MMRAVLFASLILTLASAAVAEEAEIWNENTLAIGNQWTYDADQEGVDDEGSFGGSFNMEFRVDGQETYSGVQTLLMVLEGDGQRTELNWLLTDNAVRELREQYFEDGVMLDEITLQSNANLRGLSIMPRDLSAVALGEQIDAGILVVNREGVTLGGTIQNHVTHKAQETITVPAGTFATHHFVIQRDLAADVIEGKRVFSYWIHPAIGIVKFEERDEYRENGNLFEWENLFLELRSSTVLDQVRAAIIEQLLARSSAGSDLNGDGIIDAADWVG